MSSTDTQIVKAIDDLRGNIQNLKQAAYVLDEYVNGELKSSHLKGHPSGFEYLLTSEQITGIMYMLYHVRDLAESLERAVDEAFEPSEKEGQ